MRSDRNLISEEVAIVLRTKSLFQMSIEDLRAGLDDLDSGCGHVHTKPHVQTAQIVHEVQQTFLPTHAALS